MTSFSENWPAPIFLAPVILVGAAIATYALILILKPLLRRYALARPNARSSHKEPTPQGAGMAVIGATIAAAIGAGISATGLLTFPSSLMVVLTAAIGLAVVGATDDIRPIEALPRLLLQTIAVGLVIAALPSELRLVSSLPLWVERASILFCGVWFVNLVNFMDGIDWMTVAEVVPVTGALALFGMWGLLPPDGTTVAIALCGAMLGFAPFNRPVARLFLGDVGSLSIGLLVGWLLVLLAGRGHLAAALLLTSIIWRMRPSPCFGGFLTASKSCRLIVVTSISGPWTTASASTKLSAAFLR